jgi:hypothetical protein
VVFAERPRRPVVFAVAVAVLCRPRLGYTVTTIFPAG